MLLKQFIDTERCLRDGSCMRCAVWNVYYVMQLRVARALRGRGMLHNRLRQRSLLCASCGWLCVVAALDKTNAGAE